MTLPLGITSKFSSRCLSDGCRRHDGVACLAERVPARNAPVRNKPMAGALRVTPYSVTQVGLAGVFT